MKKKTKISENKFNTHEDLCSSAINWKHTCTYQFSSDALVGYHKVVEFNDFQISYSQREGGLMHNVLSPKDSFCIAIIELCEAEACFGKIKLHTGDIIFFDDSKLHTFMSKGKIKSIILSFEKSLNPDVVNLFGSLEGYIVKDKNLVLSALLHKNVNSIVDLKEKVFSILNELINGQRVKRAELTQGEMITFEILEDIYRHMDGNISIKSLALKHHISEKTLQNSFKSLFGFTPKKFFLLLKLNLVYNELKEQTVKETTVLRIASKWGFKHIGNFSKYYTELFNENPSVTLKREIKKELIIDTSCVSTQDEI